MASTAPTEAQNCRSTPRKPHLVAISHSVPGGGAETDFRVLYDGDEGESCVSVLQGAKCRISPADPDADLLLDNLLVISAALILAGQYPLAREDLLASEQPLWAG